MLDFMRFTDSQGDDWEVVWDILDNSLRRSGRPMDALGFYKEICWRGGFVNRESAKKRIKMPDVFKQLHNHYVNHTYTDIGNNLLNTYERYFWAYERAHPEDVSNQRCVTCEQDRVEKPGQMLRCDGCGDWHHAECAAFDPTDSGIVRGVVEIVTSFVCVRCRDAARKDPKRLIAFESERVTREDLEDRMKHRAEENFTRHLAMQRRRGRRYDPSFVRPTRDPDALANKTTGKYDDKPIGTWAAAKNYVPPKNHEAVPDRTAKKSEGMGNDDRTCWTTGGSPPPRRVAPPSAWVPTSAPPSSRRRGTRSPRRLPRCARRGRRGTGAVGRRPRGGGWTGIQSRT